MQSNSRRLRDVDKVLSGGSAREILIPYSVAVVRYPTVVATILDHLHNSSATDAKSRSPEDFKWYLAYSQPDDPKNCSSESEFIKYLEDNTQVFLIARGFRWRGPEPIEGELPSQIRSRFQERARLCCVPKLEKTDVSQEYPVISEINHILSLVAALSNRENIDSGYINIAVTVFQNMKIDVLQNMKVNLENGVKNDVSILQ